MKKLTTKQFFEQARLMPEYQEAAKRINKQRGLPPPILWRETDWEYLLHFMKKNGINIDGKVRKNGLAN
jgi:hypothetical protein